METSKAKKKRIRKVLVGWGAFKSFNFGSKTNNAGRYICQLSDSDRFFGRVNFTEAADFCYTGVKVRVCSS